MRLRHRLRRLVRILSKAEEQEKPRPQNQFCAGFHCPCAENLKVMALAGIHVRVRRHAQDSLEKSSDFSAFRSVAFCLAAARAFFCASDIGRGVLYGSFAKRNGQRAQCSLGHSSTSFGWKHTQSRHFCRIVFSNSVFVVLMGITPFQNRFYADFHCSGRVNFMLCGLRWYISYTAMAALFFYMQDYRFQQAIKLVVVERVGSHNTWPAAARMPFRIAQVTDADG